MKTKLNILIFSWRGPGHPNSGGAEIVTHEHAKGWVKAGHAVTLFTATFDGAKKEEIIDGVNIIRKGSQILGVHMAAFKWYMFGKHPRYDLIIDQFHGIPFFTPFYVSEKKMAFIHEVTKEVWIVNPWNNPFNLIPAILGTIFEPLIFKFFYVTIPFMTVSDSTKEDLMAWGIPKENISVINAGLIKPKIKKLPDKEKNKTIIYLGALSKDKGIEDALRVFFELEQASKKWQFWIVGKADPSYLNKLMGQAKDLNLDKKVKFRGFVTEDRKFELLAKAHILLNPSIREGWGLVVIEAASVSTPTVAFDVPGLRDSILNGKTGILCRERSARSLANEIINLLDDKKIYKKMCSNAIVWSKNFSWSKSNQESLDLIERIVG